MRGVQWLVVMLCWQSPLWAAVVGSFDDVRNLPGYISLQRGSDVYRDPRVLPYRRGDGVEYRTASRILREDYLQDDGSIDIKAIAKKILAIKRHENVAFMTYCVEKLPRKRASHVDWCRSHADEKMLTKWRKRKLAAMYRFAISELELARSLAGGVRAETINHVSSQAFLEHLFQGLETFDSIFDHDPLRSDLYNEIRYGIDLRKIRVGFEIEAANLVIPAAVKERHPRLREQVFFAPRQLQRLARREALDISALDPHDSGFWRKPHSIRAFDTSNYNGQSGFPDSIVDQQKEIAVTYHWGGRFTGGEAKMRVRYRGKQYKMKYLSATKSFEQSTLLRKIVRYWRKHGFEVNTETVVNNLAAALGFTIDPTFYKRSVRLYLPLDDPTSEEEFEHAYQRLLEAQRRWDGHTPDKALSDINTDAKGRWYIRMRSVSLEKRSERDSYVSVGSFLRETFSRPLKREFRAFALFSAWVADVDVKSDNGNLALVGDAAGQKVVYSVSDMGFTLGSLFGKDSPNFFSRDIIERVRRKPDGTIFEVVLNYFTPFNNDGLHTMSISDAKWMTRLIAQLSPMQIRKAFRAAGYAEVVGEYFTQLMLRRRDQLVETFGLMGQTLVDAAGNHILLKQESKIVDPNTYAVEGYEQYFKNGYLHDPQGEVSDNPGDFVRRYYDRSFVNATPGTLQNAMWKTLGAWLKINTISGVSKRLQKLKVTNRTFGLPLLEGDFCTNECFYDGLRIGITNFLPQRFLLKNPYDDRERPLLLVDVYRFGFLFGADIGDDFPHRFGIDAPLNDNMPQARYQRVYEFIKVKPLASIVDSVKNLHELAPTQILKYPNIQRQLIDELQSGEALISSTYLSRGAGVQLGKYPFLGRPMISAGFDLSQITVSRKALLREDDRYLLQFSDLQGTKFWLGVRGELLLTDFPIISSEMKKLSKMDLLFEFSGKEEEHLHLLKESLVASVPPDDLDSFAVAERSITLLKRKLGLLLSPAKFFFDEVDTSSIRISDAEGVRELHTATVQEKQKADFWPAYSRHKTILESFVTDNERVFIKLSLSYDNLFGKRDHFKWVYENMLPLLGKTFILFTPPDVNFYLDEFEFKGEVYILPAGVDNIMAHLEQPMLDFCVRYANAAGASYPRRWCAAALQGDTDVPMELGHRTSFLRRAARHDHLRFRNFTSRYVAAARIWQQPLAMDLPMAERNKILRQKAHRIAKLFSANGFSPTVWRMLQNIAGEQNIYRDATITSRVGAFPAQSKVITMPAALRGEGGAQVSSIYKRIVQSVQIATDPLFAELEGVFYEPMAENQFATD